MSNLGERLRSLRMQRGVTQQDLATKLSVNRSTLANWELNRTQPDFNYILQIADLYGIPVELLLRGNFANPKEEMAKVPVYRAKADVDYLENPQIIGRETVPALSVADGEYFFLQIEDRSLTKINIPQGAKVLVRKQDTITSGKIALLFIKASSVTIRRVKFYKKLVIIYADKNEEPIIYHRNDIQIIGQIMEVRISLDY